MMERKIKFFLIILFLLMILNCGKKEGEGIKTDVGNAYMRSTQASQTPQAVKTSKDVIVFNNATEPQAIDPALSTDLTGARIILNCFEGLVKVDAENKIHPGIANSWEISDDKKIYTFHLRDAKWSDGSIIKASDFIYAWKRALSPEVGAEYTYQLYYIKNGEEYNKGKITDFELVGVKALDDKTIHVELNAPITYFLELTAFPTYMPVKEDVVSTNPDWALSPKQYIGNGPFKLVEWQHNNKMRFVKNENYWDSNCVRLKELIFTMIEDESSELTAFELGEIDITQNVPLPDVERLKQEGKLKTYPHIGTYYICFNTQKPPFNDKNVRKAFTYAIDRKKIVEKVTKRGERVALSWVPYGIKDLDGILEFREFGGDLFQDNNVIEAQRCLNEAGYGIGLTFPDVTYIYNTNEGHKVLAEAFQEMWRKNLNVQVNLMNQEWKVFLKTRREGDFQICRHGWIGDYLDPMTFMDVFVTGNGNNDAHWSNKEYDELIRKAKLSSDQKERMELMHKAEKILMEEMPICPIYFYVNSFCMKDNIKGVGISPLGFVDFSEAYKE